MLVTWTSSNHIVQAAFHAPSSKASHVSKVLCSWSNREPCHKHLKHCNSGRQGAWGLGLSHRQTLLLCWVPRFCSPPQHFHSLPQHSSSGIIKSCLSIVKINAHTSCRQEKKAILSLECSKYLVLSCRTVLRYFSHGSNVPGKSSESDMWHFLGHLWWLWQDQLLLIPFAIASALQDTLWWSKRNNCIAKCKIRRKLNLPAEYFFALTFCLTVSEWEAVSPKFPAWILPLSVPSSVLQPKTKSEERASVLWSLLRRPRVKHFIFRGLPY